MLKPDWISLWLCNSRWRPSIRLIGWLSRYISDVRRQNTSESFSFTWSLISPLTYTTRVDDADSDPLLCSGGVKDYRQDVSLPHVWQARQLSRCTQVLCTLSGPRPCWCDTRRIGLPSLWIIANQDPSGAAGRCCCVCPKNTNKSRDNGGQFFFLLFFTVQWLNHELR